MKITFACPSCAKPLVADAALAGRTGRCRFCGHRTLVPAGSPPAAVADWRTAVAGQLGTTAGPGAAAADQSTVSPGTVSPAADLTGGYRLRPITPVAVPTLAASEWDNAELGPAIDSPLAAAFPAAATVAPSLAARPVQPGQATTVVAYRLFFSLLSRATTWISETSYTVSFILIILAVASGMIGRHSLAALLCGAIVALNLVGLAGDFASLVTLSFRKNPLQGVLFLVPPFTLYYLWSDWRRYRDTVSRMRIPLITLAVVATAYLFVPWLRGGKEIPGPVDATVKRAIGTLDENLGNVRGAVDEGLKAARPWLREGPQPDPSSPRGADGADQRAPGKKP